MGSGSKELVVATECEEEGGTDSFGPQDVGALGFAAGCACVQDNFCINPHKWTSSAVSPNTASLRKVLKHHKPA